MTFLLRLKHWQLFMITTVVPFAFYIITFICVIAVFRQPLMIFKFFPLIMLLFMFGHYGWMFAAVRKLHARLPDSVKLRLNSFYFFFFFPLIYLLIFTSFVSIFITNMQSDPHSFNPAMFLPFVLVIFPVHFFSMFCIMYCYYFTAKTIKSVEMRREAFSGEYIGDFFLLWFFPVGLWFLQPRVNRLVSDLDENRHQELNS